MERFAEAIESELAALEERWGQERDLIGQIRDLRLTLESAQAADNGEAAAEGDESAEALSEEDRAKARSESVYRLLIKNSWFSVTSVTIVPGSQSNPRRRRHKTPNGVIS